MELLWYNLSIKTNPMSMTYVLSSVGKYKQQYGEKWSNEI